MNRFVTPTEDIIGSSVLKSGEEGQYDWGQTQKSSDDSIRKLKAELYRRLNEKKLPDEKAKIIQKAFRKRNNKTQKKEKKRTRSPSPSVSPDPELSGINSEFYNYEGNMIESIGSPKKVSSEPILTKLLSPSPTKKSRSANDLEAQVREDRADTPSKALAQGLNEITFEEHHKQREQRGGNPDASQIAFLKSHIANLTNQIDDLTSQIAYIKKEISDFNKKNVRLELIDTMELEIYELYYQLRELEIEKARLEKELDNYKNKLYDVLILDIREHKEKAKELLKNNHSNGGKKKSRRKLRKSGRKTKRRK